LKKEGEQLRLFIENQPKSKISIARELHISKQTLFQYFKSKELTPEIKARFEDYFGKKIFGENGHIVSTDQPAQTLNEPEPDYSQPIIQVVLNLSYTGKKNAESMDKMAATNQRNTEIIAALVSTLVPNSKFADQSNVVPDDLSEDDVVPSIEEMLGPEGIALLRRQWQAGKKKEANK
jgi:AcrR family transcriptional regulator